MGYNEPDDEMSNDIPQKKKKDATPLLDTFGKDLTKMAEDGLLEPVIGREVEIDRVIQILSRKKKNNPVLIGEPGCVLSNTKIKIRKVSDDGSHSIYVIE